MRSWRETSLGDKTAAAAKSSPEWRSWRETSLGHKTAAAAKSSPEWRSWRETSLGDKAAAAAKSSPAWRSWRETNEGRQGGSGSQEQPRVEIMKGDKAAAASRPFGDFGDQQPSHWEVRTPLSGEKLYISLSVSTCIYLLHSQSYAARPRPSDPQSWTQCPSLRRTSIWPVNSAGKAGHTSLVNLLGKISRTRGHWHDETHWSVQIV